MRIQVLGSGCPTCKKLYEITEKAVSEMGLAAKVEYVTGAEGMQKIIELGAMSSPVLVVNGSIAMTGFTADLEKIKKLLSQDDSKKATCKAGDECRGGECDCDDNKSEPCSCEGSC